MVKNTPASDAFKKELLRLLQSIELCLYNAGAFNKQIQQQDFSTAIEKLKQKEMDGNEKDQEHAGQFVALIFILFPILIKTFSAKKLNEFAEFAKNNQPPENPSNTKKKLFKY